MIFTAVSLTDVSYLYSYKENRSASKKLLFIYVATIFCHSYLIYIANKPFCWTTKSKIANLEIYWINYKIINH